MGTQKNDWIDDAIMSRCGLVLTLLYRSWNCIRILLVVRYVIQISESMVFGTIDSFGLYTTT